VRERNRFKRVKKDMHSRGMGDVVCRKTCAVEGWGGVTYCVRRHVQYVEIMQCPLNNRDGS